MNYFMYVISVYNQSSGRDFIMRIKEGDYFKKNPL